MTTRAGATFLGVLLAATPASAADVRLGVVGAMNFANLDFDAAADVVNLHTLNRWGVGGVLEVGFTDNLSLVAQPMYVGKGSKLEPPFLDLHLKLTYLELPVLLKYRFASDPVRPFLAAGPSIGFRDKAELTVRVLGQEETDSIEDQVNSTDFSLWFGGGLEIAAGVARMFFEGGYALGLTDLSDEPLADAKTRGFQVRAGVTFGL